MKWRTCPAHPGRIVENGPCQARLPDGSICGYSLEPKGEVKVETQTEEDVVETVASEATESVEMGRPEPYQVLPDCYGRPNFCLDKTCEWREKCFDIGATQEPSSAGGESTSAADFKQEAGEWLDSIRQPTLDPDIFPAVDRRDVPMVKIGVTGTVEMTRGEWEAYCDQGLEPGRVVKLTLTGYLPNPHAKYVKRSGTENNPVTGRSERYTWWEQEAQVKVKLLELGSFELRGVYDG